MLHYEIGEGVKGEVTAMYRIEKGMGRGDVASIMRLKREGDILALNVIRGREKL